MSINGISVDGVPVPAESLDELFSLGIRIACPWWN
jgi:hypothetical protein